MYPVSPFRFFLISVILCLCIVTTKVNASKVTHVDVGRVPVEDQSIQNQKRAGQASLEQVFVKMSGNKDIIKSQSISRATRNFEQFLISSSYVTLNEQLYFEARFNKDKIENLLLASGSPVWASLRPNAIVWMSKRGEIETLGSRKPRSGELASLNRFMDIDILSQNTPGDLQHQLFQSAYQRGVNILIPIGDFEDYQNVSAQDIQSQFTQSIMEHSERYDTQYVIIASLQAFDAQQAAALRRSFLGVEQNVDVPPSNTQGVDTEQQEAPSSMDKSLNADVSYDVSSVIEEENKRPLTRAEKRAELQNLIAGTEFLGAFLESNVDVPNDTEFSLDYVISNRKELFTGKIYAPTESAAIEQLVDVYADHLAKGFALTSPIGQNLNTLRISVENISSLKDYKNVLNLFESIPSIERVNLEKHQKTSAIFRVEQSISVEQLSAILSLDRRLQKTTGNDQSLVGIPSSEAYAAETISDPSEFSQQDRLDEEALNYLYFTWKN